MHTIHEKIRLARAFGTEVQAAFTTSEFRQMLDRNKFEDNPGVCHTHDFCDANMLMAAAFLDTLGREIDMNDDGDLELWGDAWSIAIAAEFFA